jgi:hypothetical protein
MVLTDMQKRADVVGYLGFDDYGYLIPTTVGWSFSPFSHSKSPEQKC